MNYYFGSPIYIRDGTKKYGHKLVIQKIPDSSINQVEVYISTPYVYNNRDDVTAINSSSFRSCLQFQVDIYLSALLTPPHIHAEVQRDTLTLLRKYCLLYTCRMDILRRCLCLLSNRGLVMEAKLILRSCFLLKLINVFSDSKNFPPLFFVIITL